jgi:hypothetical protein
MIGDSFQFEPDPEVVSEEVLKSVERTLSDQINLCTGMIGTAFEHMKRLPNQTGLLAVDRAIDLLRFFQPQASCLRDCGYPALELRLKAILDDASAARATWAKTIGVLQAADQLDRSRLVQTQREIVAIHKQWIMEYNTKAKERSDEVGKLLRPSPSR